MKSIVFAFNISSSIGSFCIWIFFFAKYRSKRLSSRYSRIPETGDGAVPSFDTNRLLSVEYIMPFRVQTVKHIYQKAFFRHALKHVSVIVNILVFLDDMEDGFQ